MTNLTSDSDSPHLLSFSSLLPFDSVCVSFFYLLVSLSFSPLFSLVLSITLSLSWSVCLKPNELEFTEILNKPSMDFIDVVYFGFTIFLHLGDSLPLHVRSRFSWQQKIITKLRFIWVKIPTEIRRRLTVQYSELKRRHLFKTRDSYLLIWRPKKSRENHLSGRSYRNSRLVSLSVFTGGRQESMTLYPG